MSSCSFASEAEVSAYPFISNAVLMHCNGFPVLFSSDESAVRVFPIDDDLCTFLRREYRALQGKTSPQFKLYSEGSNDEKKRKRDLNNCFSSGTVVQVDYFAYVDAQQTSRAVKQMTIAEALKANANANAVATRGSDPGERRKIVVFEISNAPEGLYKIAQLERDLKVIAYRQTKKGFTDNPLDVVALAGVSLKSSAECALVQCFLADTDFKDYAPRIHELHQQKKIAIVCHSPQLASLTPSGPLSVWVRYGTAVFKVTPAENIVDSLKDAVKAKMQLTMPAPLLTVKDDKGNVLKASAALQANTEETAYVVE